jgi:hypothetical protein
VNYVVWIRGRNMVVMWHNDNKRYGVSKLKI